MSDFDIVCYTIDLGHDYEPLLNRMIESARAVMPNAHLVCCTSTPDGKIGKGWDHIVTLPDKISFANLCIERSRMTVSWMLRTNRPVIFTDPDIEFKNPIPWEQLAQVNLLWRTSKPDQPVNEGLVIAKPGAPQFWLHYGKIAVNLPKVLYSWWCDQLAFSILTGACHKSGDLLQLDDAQVRLIDGRRYCPNSDDPKIRPEAWALHYKGQRKGPGWEKVFTKRNREEYGAGKSWPGSVSSTGTLVVPSSGFPPDDSVSSSAPMSSIST